MLFRLSKEKCKAGRPMHFGLLDFSCLDARVPPIPLLPRMQSSSSASHAHGALGLGFGAAPCPEKNKRADVRGRPERASTKEKCQRRNTAHGGPRHMPSLSLPSIRPFSAGCSCLPANTEHPQGSGFLKKGAAAAGGLARGQPHSHPRPPTQPHSKPRASADSTLSKHAE